MRIVHNRKLVWVMAAACSAMLGCEDEAALEDTPAEAAPVDAEEAPTEAAPAADAAPGPADACKALVEAAKAGNADAYAAHVAEAPADDAAKKAVMDWFGTAECGDATVEGETATVAVSAGETMREASFAKTADAWKLNAAAFAEKYPAADAAAPEKGKKAKKGKKGRKGKRK